MNLIVSDASPIRYLVEIDAAHVLPKLFSKVILPEHVAAIELQSPKTPLKIRVWVAQAPAWVEVRRPLQHLKLNLHTGEEQAIALALELNSPLLLDEKEARAIATAKGLTVIGTLGLIELAASKNLLNLSECLAALQRTNIRLHPTLIEATLKIAKSGAAKGGPTRPSN